MQMGGKKALFLDIDGTLVTDDKKIPEANSRAISKMLAEGHSVIIATGRPLSSAIKLAGELGLTEHGCYVIAFNGGVLYDVGRKKEIFRATMPLAAAKKAFVEAEKRGVHIHTYDAEEVLVEPFGEDEELRRYCERIKIGYKVVPDIMLTGEDPVKMLIIDFDDPAPLEEFRSWLASWASDIIDSYFSCAEYVEIVRKGLDKGKALIQMADILGIPVEDTIAAGDQANDLEMIKAAGIGCAMKNGTEEVKTAADYVTELDNNEGGVAEIIEGFVLS